MATRTRYKSSSPAPTAAPIMMATSIPHSLPPSPALASTLSSNMFPSPPRSDLNPPQRMIDLAILGSHNSRPFGETSIVLPPASSLLGDGARVGHVLGQEPARGAFGFPHHPLPIEVEPRRPPKESFYLPFSCDSHPATARAALPVDQKPRSNLSIQSLISPPAADYEMNGHGERGMKRKGSEIMDRDMDDAMARSSRGTSVVSTSTTGLSMEDPDVRDAVEALGGLKADFAHPPTAPNSPPSTRQEPLMNLIQSSASSVHPLLSTALSISTSTYAASKNYIPPFRYVAESAENITVPVVRRTGLEGYIRRGLTRHRSNDAGGEKKRRKSDKDTSPAEKQGQLVEVQTRERGWQTRLYYSSTGLATALSDESRRSLKYCLKILFAANSNLVKVIETLSSVVDELDQYLRQKRGDSPSASNASAGPGIAGYLPESYEQRRMRLSETVDRLKDEALKTLKTVVDTISRYAGGALPENARNVVKRQLLSFPIRWQAATSSTDVERGVVVPNAEEGKTKGKAVRVLVMAKEGLDMMRGVAEVVEGTLVSAEEWCERFGKGKPAEEENKKTGEKEPKRVSWVDAPNGAIVAAAREENGDITMAKAG